MSKKPTKAELELKFKNLQQTYEQELDKIFADLYNRLEEIEPSVAVAGSVPKEASPKAPETRTAAPESPVAPESPAAPEPPVTPKMADKWKLPRWRDTWRYQGLKGLGSRIWRGTNPEQDIAWKYAGNEGQLPRLTLQEYLVLREAANDYVDYYFVVEESVNPEVGKALSDASEKIKSLIKKFLTDAHELGISLGDIVATTKYMFPPKQTDLDFSKESPSDNYKAWAAGAGEKEKFQSIKPPQPELSKEFQPSGPSGIDLSKKPETPTPEELPPKLPRKGRGKGKGKEAPKFTNEQIEGQKEILRKKVNNDKIYGDLLPFKPWTWFLWAKEPSEEQWKDQAAHKFAQDLEGLTNLFNAIHNKIFTDITLKSSDTQIKQEIGKLFGLEKAPTGPNLWRKFIELGGKTDDLKKVYEKPMPIAPEPVKPIAPAAHVPVAHAPVAQSVQSQISYDDV